MSAVNLPIKPTRPPIGVVRLEPHTDTEGVFGVTGMWSQMW